MNPLSIPGGWSKDKDRSRDSPATEQKNPTEDASVPRSAVGTVNDAGEIVDSAGQSIGKIPESQDPKELAGNTVSAAGDIVSDTGDVLGKATGLDLGNNDDENASEYTTKGVEDGDDSSGFNVVGKAKGALSSLSGSNRGSQVGGSEADLPDTKNATEGVEDNAHDAGETAQTDNLKDQAEETTDDAQKNTAETTEDAQDKAADAKDKVEETTEDAQDKAAETSDAAGDKSPQADVEGKTDELKDEADVDAKTEDLKDQADPESKPDELKDEADVDGKTEDLKDETDPESKTDELKGEANVDGKTEDLKDQTDPESKTDEFKDEAEQKTDEVTDDAKAPGDELKDQTEEKAGDVTEEVNEKADEAGEQAEGAKEDVEKTGEELADGQTGEEGDADEKKDDEEGEKEEALDYSVLKGTKVNKLGKLVNDHGEIIGEVVQGNVKQLIGKSADANGIIWTDGEQVGKAKPLSDADRQDHKKTSAPFENFPDATVEADGKIMHEGKQVGVLIEGDAKKLKGSKVDEDGDVLDRNGNVVGKAEAWDEPEAEPEQVVDNSALAGKRVNKAGNVVSKSGEIYGRVIEGNVASMIGRMCDKDGNIRSESGDILGKAELVPEGEREGLKEGPFAELNGCTVGKDGKVYTPSGDVVGRLTSGDAKTLAGRTVDDDGEIVDANGNVLGKAERWEEPEEEKKKGPMAGMTVSKDGNVRDQGGEIVGKLVSGDAMVCAGKEVDDDGDVLNSKGQTVGHVVLIEDVPEEPKEEETPEEKEKREQAEKDKKLANQLGYQIEQSLEKIRPICKRINDKIDAEERKPKDERDEEQLVKNVRPLIEDGGKILTEVNGVIRGMDPDGRIQRNAKQKSASREATPEEFHLADLLKELTGTVTECIDSAKRKIEDMPHAKKELSPLWGLLSEPLFQILAAVGLLLNGVLGIVGRLLSGLGLGGLVDGLLGSLGLDKILGGLGLGDALGALTGKKKK
ncbi:hypothetical protein NLU13_4371 [Sarocladium strictum]|uniref:DUF6987 domain-containing protein n=1 Tax=Sarocladium strictum TaxID=5046 RepID=A0AA39L8L3_SARSR|nr:hypothetical protein NLU13_4371 [Sarocladium strictum]